MIKIKEGLNHDTVIGDLATSLDLALYYINHPEQFDQSEKETVIDCIDNSLNSLEEVK
jgi:hypothetical protein